MSPLKYNDNNVAWSPSYHVFIISWIVRCDVPYIRLLESSMMMSA